MQKKNVFHRNIASFFVVSTASFDVAIITIYAIEEVEWHAKAIILYFKYICKTVVFVECFCSNVFATLQTHKPFFDNDNVACLSILHCMSYYCMPVQVCSSSAITKKNKKKKSFSNYEKCNEALHVLFRARCTRTFILER